MSIPTPESLRKMHRKQDRLQQQIDRFVNLMRRRDCALHCYYVNGGAMFVFSEGTRVPQAIGLALASDPNVVPVDPPLIPGGLAQTFRYTPERRTDHE